MRMIWRLIHGCSGGLEHSSFEGRHGRRLSRVIGVVLVMYYLASSKGAHPDLKFANESMYAFQVLERLRVDGTEPLLWRLTDRL
jgi:hypothetical protein